MKYNLHLNLQTAMYMTVALLLAVVPFSLIGCHSIAQKYDPIPVVEFLASIPEATEGVGIAIAPCGLRFKALHRWIIVDIVVVGKTHDVGKTAFYIKHGIRNNPNDWLEIMGPDNKLLDIVEPSYSKGTSVSVYPFPTPLYSVALEDGRIKTLVQTGVRTNWFNNVNPGQYEVRLRGIPPSVSELLIDDLVIDTESHTFEIKRARIIPRSDVNWPEINMAESRIKIQ